MKEFFRNIYRLLNQTYTRKLLNEVRALNDMKLQQDSMILLKECPNPLNRFGKKCFSQTDEDGITIEIVRRLNIKKGNYIEYGVGNGLENNTLILAAMGWCGFWVGGEELAFNYRPGKRFMYIRDWITLDNIYTHTQAGYKYFNFDNPDVVSLDLDGNDIYFVEMLLQSNVLPRLFIVEYNAKFFPPVRFQIAYDEKHVWGEDDYFGAALMNFVDLFSKHGYQLVCCNAHSGGNAFFVKTHDMHLFSDVPNDIFDLYNAPRYYLYNSYAHKPSSKMVELILGD